jgi:pimeloyl-ACP methyl ester carboxylesterase
MDRFTTSDGVAIAVHRFEPDTVDPDLPLVVLQHGFAADTRANWVVPGIVDALRAAGRRVMSVDARGHGVSDKPHDPASYGEGRMSRDLIELFDSLALDEVDLVGYSMGAIVSAITATTDRRIRRLVIGGIGGRVARFDGTAPRGLDRSAIVAGMLADDPATVTDPGARAFRRFADSTGADRRALAAQMRSAHSSRIPLGDIAATTLLLVGDKDALAAEPEVLAAAIPGCAVRVVPGDHLSAVAQPAFIAALVDFVGQR